MVVTPSPTPLNITVVLTPEEAKVIRDRLSSRDNPIVTELWSKLNSIDLG